MLHYFPDSLKQFFLLTHFCFAFTVGFVPAWGQTPPDVQITIPIKPQSDFNWNGESVAVICPPMFQQALEPWLVYRTNQGYQIYILDEPKSRKSESPFPPESEQVNTVPHTTPEFLKHRIRALVNKDPTVKYLLIVGDAVPDIKSEATASERLIPASRVDALVISKFGKEKDIATDNYYADLNDDNIPELAVGRFPVDTPDELAAVINKIIRYESEIDLGLWQRRINLVAGVGGFSPLIDTQIESAARYILSEMIHEGYDLSLTQANWKSAYCPAPEMFRSVTIERMNEGCLFWVYMGHGHHKSLDYLRTPLADYSIFIDGDAKYAKSRSGFPIAIFCACYTGAFDAIEDCIAEDLLRQPDGPVAVISSSRVAMPYGMAVFGLELIDGTVGHNKTQTANGSEKTTPTNSAVNLGTVFLRAKQKMLASPTAKERNVSSTLKNSADTVLSVPANALQSIGSHLNVARTASESRTPSPQRPKEAKENVRGMIETMAWLSDPTSHQLHEQLIDHAHLFHLFGDPLLKIPLPEHISVTAAQDIEAGGTLVVSGKTAPGASILVELVTPRYLPVAVPKERRPFKMTEESDEEFMSTYLKANNRSLQYVGERTQDGDFRVELPIPDDIKGPHIVRVFAATRKGTSVGSTTVTVSPKSVATSKKAQRK